MLELVLPHPKYLTSVIPAIAEYKTDKAYRTYAIEKMIEAEESHFDTYFKHLGEKMEGINLSDGHVACTTLWLIEDGRYVGTFDVRHSLTDYLRQYGGHIGYEIRPSERQKGYAKVGLKLCLDYVYEKLGLENVLITCNATNEGSYKTILSTMIEMGGHEIDLTQKDNEIRRRFWIRTAKRHDGKTIRVSAMAVIKKKGHILATQGYDPKTEQLFYRLPGGGIDFGETGQQAVIRELKEELGLDIIVEKQLGVVENIFTFSGKKGHEVILLYLARLSDEDMKKNEFPMIEPEFEGKFAEFVSVDTNFPIYPIVNRELLR